MSVSHESVANTLAHIYLMSEIDWRRNLANSEQIGRHG
jgi:hypothetical protein